MKVKKAAPKTPGRKPLYPEIGVTGLRRYSGFVFEEFLRDLRGQRGMQVYREIKDNSAKVGAALGAVTSTALGVPWSVVAGDEPDAENRRTFVESCLHDMSFSWRDTLREAFSMLPFGFAPLEIVYKRRLGDTRDPRGRSRYDDGLIGWRKLPIRAQETVFKWEFDDEGGIQGLFQLAPPNFQLVFIPIEKLLLFRTTVERNNPEGRSVLRNAYLSYYIAKRLTESTVIGVERDLNGIPVMWVPPELLADDSVLTPEQRAAKAQYYQVVKNLRQDEQAGLVLPLVYDDAGRKLYDLTLLTTTGRRQFDLVALLQHFEGAIAASMLHDLLMGGQANTIQYRGAQMPDMFAASIGFALDTIKDVFNTHAIPRLYRVNGWETSSCAHLHHGSPTPADLGKLADFISKVAPQGFLGPPDEATDRHLRRLAGLPDAGSPLLPPPDEDPDDEDPDDEGPDDTDAAPDDPGAGGGVAAEKLRKEPATLLDVGELLKRLGAELAAQRQAPLVIPPPNVTVNVPERPAPAAAPNVTVNQAPSPGVTVNVPAPTPTPPAPAPDVTVNVAPPPPAEVTVNVAAAPAPSVNVAPPPPAEVNVHVDPPPPAEVTVNVQAAPAPSVNIAPPPPAEVNVHVDPPPPAEVTVNVAPPPPAEVSVQVAAPPAPEVNLPPVNVTVQAPVIEPRITVEKQDGPLEVRIVEPVETRVTDLPTTVETTEVTERDGTGIKGAIKVRRTLKSKKKG
jgi:hypothetical protein